MIRIIFSFLLLIFVTTACDNDEKGIELDIVETGCANGWDDFYESTGEYKHAVTAYLEDHNIAVYSVNRVTYDTGPFCLACFCSTGNLIVVQINNNDVDKAEQLGFNLVVNDQFNIPKSE
ncbi:hypothetical protein [Draconibacterium halophilum]|uniref:Uncharacterized protein n=1 Tax=Draconibacterium halophilum TaxID=2706887 RepID=A0A6C0RI49_9BACT|nr:hypothetical protein [Draconibacterium halophilum]QIA08781.1 hypothetical protein G0Q07_14100 [Draconibacterium halophilum]